MANAGTTNTGAVDPLVEIAELGHAEGMWFHADGAYGAAAVLDPRGRQALLGLDRADSLSLDPHKWLFQPYDAGCVLVRDRETLRQAFHMTAEYMRDAKGPQEEGSFWNYGPELTRPFRAFPFWMSVQVFGMAAFRKAIAAGFDQAEAVEQLLRSRPQWQVVTPAQLGILTFRYADREQTEREVDHLTRRIALRASSEGFAAILSTELNGRPVLRMCTINPRTTAADLADSVLWLERIARQELS